MLRSWVLLDGSFDLVVRVCGEGEDVEEEAVWPRSQLLHGVVSNCPSVVDYVKDVDAKCWSG